MKQAKKQQVKSQIAEEELTAAPDQQHYEDEPEAFHQIDCMQEHGINMADIMKLKAAGLATCLSILMW